MAYSLPQVAHNSRAAGEPRSAKLTRHMLRGQLPAWARHGRLPHAATTAPPMPRDNGLAVQQAHGASSFLLASSCGDGCRQRVKQGNQSKNGSDAKTPDCGEGLTLFQQGSRVTPPPCAHTSAPPLLDCPGDAQCHSFALPRLPPWEPACCATFGPVTASSYHSRGLRAPAGRKQQVPARRKQQNAASARLEPRGRWKCDPAPQGATQSNDTTHR